jgi:hypothetical protein
MNMSQLLISPNQDSSSKKRIVVPYITSWSRERDVPYTLVERPGVGIAYADETLADRDSHGVLWQRSASRPHHGRPQFGKVHPLRQRRAMRKLLCQVCGGPADHTNDGVLWVLPDHREDWVDWPDGMANVEPPICQPCVRLSLRLCPRLRMGAVVIRVRQFPIAGVRGVLYQRNGAAVAAVDEAVVAFDDPAIRWVCAANLVRQLGSCTIMRPAEFADQLTE